METFKYYFRHVDAADGIIFVGLIGTAGYTTVMIIGRILGAF
jgi:hypothetical protein